MHERMALLFANEAFYAAFAGRDYPAMDALWARRAPVACIHPGWGVLEGREAVMESWRGILGNTGNAPSVTPRDARAFVLGEAGYVTCFEAFPEGFLIATNLFVREEGEWRLVHHQAGPTRDQPPEDEDEDDPTRPRSVQ